MTDFSVGDAGVEGLKLIGRKPLTVIAWGLFIFVAMILPVGLLMAWLWPMLQEVMESARNHAGDNDVSDFPRMMRMQARMMMFNPLFMLVSIFGRAVLVAAVFRAVLEPKNSAFAYLRLGSQELWIGLVLLVESYMLALGVICAAIPIAVVAIVLGVNHMVAGAVAVGCLGVLALIIGVIWVALRLSMAAPLSFVERRFALFESWNFTKGHAGRLFTLALLVIILVILMEVVVGAIFGAVVFAGGLSMSSHTDEIRSFFEHPMQSWLPVVAPIALGVGLVYSLVIGVFVTVAMAPWAAAYKGLAKSFTATPGVAGLTLDG